MLSTGVLVSNIIIGNVVENRLSDKSDCRSKRALFIGNANKCIGNYNNHKACTKINLYQAYYSSFLRIRAVVV